MFIYTIEAYYPPTLAFMPEFGSNSCCIYMYTQHSLHIFIGLDHIMILGKK